MTGSDSARPGSAGPDSAGPDSAAEVVDVLVVGGGPIGLACGWQAAARGQRAAVLDRHGFFNERCGTSGAERHWRLQYTQEDLFRLTLQTAPLWERLEHLAERTLLHRIGSLWFGDVDVDTNEGRIAETMRVMDRLDVPYQALTASDVERRFGFTDVPRHYGGFLQPDGGTIDVRGTLAALYGLAQRHGCRLHSGERALACEPDADGVTVRTTRTTYRAGSVVLAAGASVNDLLGPLGATLDVRLYEMPLIAMRRRDTGVDFPFWYVFQQPTDRDTNLFYGFGANPWSPSELLRLGPVFEVDPLPDADHVTGVPDPRHVERLTTWVARHLPSVDPAPVHRSTCLAVLPTDPSRQFYLGTASGLVPHGERLVISAAGWGFKFAPLIGEVCVDLAVDGSTRYDIARLAPTATTGAGR